MNDIGEVLKNLGFDEKEVKVYLAIIKSGDSPALKISQETRIDRTTIYDILERLISKGIVSSYIKNKSKHFSTLSPEKLLYYFKEKYSSLENILPELNKITNQTAESVKCELFTGKEGLKTISKDIVNNAKRYLVIGIRREYEEILGFFNEQAILKLNKLRAKERAIVEKDAKFVKLKYSQYRYLSKKLLSPITTLIYENNVIFFIWQEPYFAVRIESETLAKAQTEYFRILWKYAAPNQ